MPAVSWNVFEGLPGSAEANFEAMCRGLVRRHYGQHGEFRALAAQPGVEFHLKLQTACPLGASEQWYGWQCRWYDLPGGRALGSARRNKIAKAIKTTEKVLPGLTDWVLWTRRPLTKGDSKWFFGLKTAMQLHSWTSAEVEEHLSGPAEILRGTYFGELVLTPDVLSRQHEIAVAPIRGRWLVEVHQTVDAERDIRRMLCETDSWEALRYGSSQLTADALAVEADMADLTGGVVGPAKEVQELTSRAARILNETFVAFERGDLDLLRTTTADQPLRLSAEIRALPRQLRTRRVHAALTVTNALAGIRRAREVIGEVAECSTTRLVAVLADAGCGKTQLAAQLTAATAGRPAGTLLHGRDLGNGGSLDDLAKRVTIQGTAVPTMEALIAAVDAAGQRAKRRMPIVIDGLNEAEDPRDWRPLLAAVAETLKQYPYVLLVVTVRTAFRDEAIPPDLPCVEIQDFGRDAIDAMRRYFTRYRIKSADAEFPMELLRHPLTLRLFCEVTNPKRERDVGVEAMPGSLNGLFDRYLDQAAVRVAELAPRSRRYYEQDVRQAFALIGTALWDARSRTLDETALRRTLGDDARPWNESILRALEHEGVVIRSPGDLPGAYVVSVVFDALAGHLVADTILRREGGAGIAAWLRTPAAVDGFSTDPTRRHPLADDTFRGLAGLLPRRLPGRQLWSLLAEPLRTVALRYAAELESAYLDAQTVDELRRLVTETPDEMRRLLRRLQQTRGSATHPLNAEFLDSFLRPMAVGDRDFSWTEWIRSGDDNVLADLQRIESRWRARGERSQEDLLRARWVMWTLTSTVRELRDQATRTLYWYGRGDPDGLFRLTIDAMDINDPYVSERLLAASFGVVMAHQLPSRQFGEALRTYLANLREAMVGTEATLPTSHWLARLYAQGAVSMGATYYPDALPTNLSTSGTGRIPFAPGPLVELLAKDDPRAVEVRRTLHMDFENYTIGRLCDDRRNYDMEHPGHQAAVAHVLGTVRSLGWREAIHGAIDKRLSEYGSRGNRRHVERYGKKYGWIGFYTYAGQLDDAGELPRDERRLSDVDIDPSFPELPPVAPIVMPTWCRATPKQDRDWIRRGKIDAPDGLFYLSKIGEHPGPWMAVDGYLDANDEGVGRRAWGRLSAALVPSAGVAQVTRILTSNVHPARQIPEVPDDHYTFAGEMPWSPEFAAPMDGDSLESQYRGSIRTDDGSRIEVEILAHCYAWESYHSPLNQAGGMVVPSKVFSAAFDLRGEPQFFRQILPDGSPAAVALRAPSGFEGRLLYLREDLVHRFAAGRRLVWFVWGVRQLSPFPMSPPEWLNRARQEGAEIWRVVRWDVDLSQLFRSRSRRRSRGRVQ